MPKEFVIKALCFWTRISSRRYMRALDATIRREADYYRKILREEGIRGLLDAM